MHEKREDFKNFNIYTGRLRSDTMAGVNKNWNTINILNGNLRSFYIPTENNNMLVVLMIKVSCIVADKAFYSHQSVYVKLSTVLG